MRQSLVSIRSFWRDVNYFFVKAEGGNGGGARLHCYGGDGKAAGVFTDYKIRKEAI